MSCSTAEEKNRKKKVVIPHRRLQRICNASIAKDAGPTAATSKNLHLNHLLHYAGGYSVIQRGLSMLSGTDSTKEARMGARTL